MEIFRDKKFGDFREFYDRWCPKNVFLDASPRRNMCETVMDLSLNNSILDGKDDILEHLMSQMDYPQNAYLTTSYSSTFDTTTSYYMSTLKDHISYSSYRNCSIIKDTPLNQQINSFGQNMILAQKLNNRNAWTMMSNHLQLMQPIDSITANFVHSYMDFQRIFYMPGKIISTIFGAAYILNFKRQFTLAV